MKNGDILLLALQNLKVCVVLSSQLVGETQIDKISLSRNHY